MGVSMRCMGMIHLCRSAFRRYTISSLRQSVTRLKPLLQADSHHYSLITI